VVAGRRSQASARASLWRAGRGLGCGSQACCGSRLGGPLPTGPTSRVDLRAQPLSQCATLPITLSQAGRAVADFLGTDHHEFNFTVQVGGV
jgi:hypothetical protein